MPHAHNASATSLPIALENLGDWDSQENPEVRKVEKTASTGPFDRGETEFAIWCLLRNPSTPSVEVEAYSELAFKHYRFISKSWAWKYNKHKMPYASLLDAEDIEAFADLGLWECVRRFDPTMGNTFHTFAFKRVKGAIIDGLRQIQNFTRSVSKVRRELAPLVESLRQELQHEPTPEELAIRYDGKRLGDYSLMDEVLKDPLVFASVFNNQSGGYRKEEMNEAANTMLEISVLRQSPNRQLTPMQIAERIELIHQVYEILERDGEEWSVIFSYFFLGLNQNEIARRYKMSPTRVANKKETGLMKLRLEARSDREFEEALKSWV